MSILYDGALRFFETRAPGSLPTWLAGNLLQHLRRLHLQEKQMQALQWLRLKRALRRAFEHSPFYRQMLEEAGIQPQDIRHPEDLARLPFTTQNDLRDAGRFLAVPENRLAAVYATSGSSGEPKRVFFTAAELSAAANVAALGMRMQVQGRLVALVALPAGLWIGSAEACRVVEHCGGLPLPVGNGDPSGVLAHMRRFSPNIIITSPSYMTALTRAAQQLGFQQPVDSIWFGGEALFPEQETWLREYWGAQIFVSYGLTEIGGGQAVTLPGCPNYHPNGLQLITEIVDPESGQPANTGELVFTPLERVAMPLLRYRSGDLAEWTDCGCWPFRSFRLAGRLDDLIVAGDMNLYGQVIARAVADVPGTSGKVSIRVERVDRIDRLQLEVEGKMTDVKAVQRNLEAAIPELPRHLALGLIRLEIEVVDALENQFKPLKITDLRR